MSSREDRLSFEAWREHSNILWKRYVAEREKRKEAEQKTLKKNGV